MALDILEQARVLSTGAWVFTGRMSRHLSARAVNSAVRREAAEIRLNAWTPHDLRRSAASQLGALGIQRITIGKILNHSEPGVTAVYDRHTYLAEKRAALDSWGEKLTAIVGA